jgi:hypothetical protein
MFMHYLSENIHSLIPSVCKREAHITCLYVRKRILPDLDDTNASKVQFASYCSTALRLIHLFSFCDFVLLLLHDVKPHKTKV